MQVSAAISVLFLVSAAHAQWRQISTESEPSPSKGLEHRYVVAEHSETGDRASLELAVFSAKSCRLRIIDQPNEPRVDLEESMTRGNFLAGVNGGYFDPARKSMEQLSRRCKRRVCLVVYSAR